MAKLIAVTFCPTGIAHSMMAAEALKKTAALLGHDIQVEVHGAMGTTNPLLDETIAAADAVLIAADIHVETEPFVGKPLLTVSTSRAIREPRAVLADLLALVPGLVQAPAQPTAPVAPGPAAGPTPTAVGRRIVAITACPTGIATPSWPRMR
jgi:fructose PTS system EIIBC or EIIC component